MEFGTEQLQRLKQILALRTASMGDTCDMQARVTSRNRSLHCKPAKNNQSSDKIMSSKFQVLTGKTLAWSGTVTMQV